MANGIVGRVLSGAVGVVGLLALPASLSAQTTAVPTFTKDVAPIFQNKCESCHRPDSIAPMSLITYRRGASVGALDSRARGVAQHAALAHRQDGRHPALQG